MKSLKDRCIEFLKDKDIRNDMKEIITPLFDMIYFLLVVTDIKYKL